MNFLRSAGGKTTVKELEIKFLEKLIKNLLRWTREVWACRKNGQIWILRRASDPKCEENRPTE